MAQFTNQAQLSYNGSVINSNIAVGEILEALSAAKTAVTATYRRGDSITYIISAINSGSLPITGLTVSDNLGAYSLGTATLYPLTYTEGSVRLFINGVLQPAPAVEAGPPLQLSGITLPAGSNMVLVYEVEANQFAPLGTDGSIVNTATITGNGIPTPVAVSETVTPENGPELTITKSIEPVPVTENGRVTYRFLIQNYGNTAADAEANVTLTDTFDPVLDNLTVLFNGETWTEGVQYTYDRDTGLFATVPGQITVPAATYTQVLENGEWVVTPGSGTLVVIGTI